MKAWIGAASILTLVVGAACTTGSSAAQKQTSPTPPQSMTAREKAEGAKAHPQLLAEFGGLYEGPQAAYVTRIGRAIAAQSGLANQPSEFTVSLLNSPVNNAFAIPGGYVYVTRQLMALMNNEAELASVLGHEVGHVAAQHGQKRNRRASRAGLGAVLATVLGGVLLGNDGARLGQQLGGALAQQYVLSYSRAQEYEADDLGIVYITKAGYEPSAAAGMLSSLAAQTALDVRASGKNEKPLPEWASTHPDPGSRVVRAQQRAASVRASASQSQAPFVNRDSFLAILDGMIYDDDPKQGIVDGSRFRHPELRLSFDAPPGYVISNGSAAVSIRGTGGQAQFTGAAYQGDLDAYIAAAFRAVAGSKSQISASSVRRTEINGLPAAYSSARATTSSGPVDVTIFAYEFAKDRAYHIVSITPQGTNSFIGLFQSVRRISPAEADGIRPRRVSVVTVRQGDSVASLAERMAYPDYRQERFRVLNGLGKTDVLTPGQKIKIIVRG